MLNLLPGTGSSSRSGSDSSSGPALGNRWLHDVLDIAEEMQAQNIEIILDEQVV